MSAWSWPVLCAVAVAQSPYAGESARRIKALSAQEIKAYEQGHGAGLARAAELNQYPGPRHVLEQAASLELSAEQRVAVQAAYDRMHAEAIMLGREIVAREEALDRSFRERTIEPAALLAATAEIARLQGRLRATHLLAHVETRALLSAEQIARYDHLRGYAGEGHDPSRHASPSPGVEP